MSKTQSHGFILGLMIIIGLGCVSGCINSYSDVKLEPSDPTIALSNASKVEVGKTTKAQILAMFGPSCCKDPDSNGEVTLRYTYKKTTEKNFSFIPFVNTRDNTTEEAKICFTLKDDIVTNVSIR